MKEKRKLNKLKVSIVIIFLILTIAITVFGRYIYNTAREAYFASKQFYFSSDILTLEQQKILFDSIEVKQKCQLYNTISLDVGLLNIINSKAWTQLLLAVYPNII